MSFDLEQCETKFEEQKREIEQQILQLQTTNNRLQAQSLKSDEILDIREFMKQELKKIRDLILQIEVDSNRDQKFQLNQIKKKILKLEEQHKILLKQIVKNSLTEQFDKLSLNDQEVILRTSSSSSSKPIQWIAQQPQSLLSKQLSGEQNSHDSSPEKPLLQEDQQNRQSNEEEVQAVQQLNQEYIDYQKLLEEQDKLKNYEEEIDKLVSFDKSNKKCFKFLIIGTLLLLVVCVIIFLILYFL